MFNQNRCWKGDSIAYRRRDSQAAKQANPLAEALAQVYLNDGHHTALMLAAMNGHAPVVKLLLENGAQVDQVCYRSDTTALMLAAGYGHAQVVELLLEAGVAKDVHELECGARYTALMQASGNGHAQVVQLLLEAGADKDVRVHGCTALMLATSRGDRTGKPANPEAQTMN